MQYSIEISAIGCYNNVIKNLEVGFYGNREEDQSDPTEVVDESDRICFAFGSELCHGQPLGERKDRAELPRPAQVRRSLQREGYYFLIAVLMTDVLMFRYDNKKYIRENAWN